MSTFTIKILAVLLMVVDHIAAYLFPDLLGLRIIGRLSFPLFAWLIANGYMHTRNVNRYLLRLVALAIISQYPYALVNNGGSTLTESLNIFFTLSLGLMALMLLNFWRNLFWKIAVIGLSVVMAGWLDVSYGPAGVLSMVAFYYTFRNIRLMLAIQLAIWGWFYTLPWALWLLGLADPTPLMTLVGLFQPVAAVAVGIIAFYNGQLGRPLKYAFYFFYPVHLLVFYGIKLLIS